MKNQFRLEGVKMFFVGIVWFIICWGLYDGTEVIVNNYGIGIIGAYLYYTIKFLFKS